MGLACIILCSTLPSLGHRFSSTTVSGSTEVWENPLVGSDHAHFSELLGGLWIGRMAATQDPRCLLLQRRGGHHGPPWFIHRQGAKWLSGGQELTRWREGGKLSRLSRQLDFEGDQIRKLMMWGTWIGLANSFILTVIATNIEYIICPYHTLYIIFHPPKLRVKSNYLYFIG